MVGNQDVIITSVRLHCKFSSQVRIKKLDGSNIRRSTSLVFSPALVDKVVIFSAAAATGNCFFWSRCLFSVISGSGRYSEISFSLSTGYVEKYLSFIA